MSGRFGIAEYRHLANMPGVAKDAWELAPVGAIENERMPFEFFLKDVLQHRSRSFLVIFLKAVRLPALVGHLEDPRRHVLRVLIGVCADDAVFCFLKEERKVSERAFRTHPAKAIAAR